MTGIPKGDNIWGETRGENIYLTGVTNADFDFIAHARQDIPLLLAEIERLNNLQVAQKWPPQYKTEKRCKKAIKGYFYIKHFVALSPQ